MTHTIWPDNWEQNYSLFFPTLSTQVLTKNDSSADSCNVTSFQTVQKLILHTCISAVYNMGKTAAFIMICDFQQTPMHAMK